ncbi:MAG TPA: hypothetical protein VJM69_01975, partial [Dehalococcoidia bacterium]|nr:hypothetical protein [Dehalococcoidia bacterium]
PLAGTVKTFRVAARAPYLEVLYRLPEEPERFGVEFCLSPDYLGLLRKGRQAVRLFSGRWERGYRSGATWVWVRVPPGEPVIWDAPVQAECGHGAILRLAAYRREFRLQIGVGAPAPSGGEPGDGQKASSAMPAGVRAEKVGVR